MSKNKFMNCTGLSCIFGGTCAHEYQNRPLRQTAFHHVAVTVGICNLVYEKYYKRFFLSTISGALRQNLVRQSLTLTEEEGPRRYASLPGGLSHELFINMETR